MLCIAAKVPEVVRQAKEAIQQGQCVVIGLQSTGEAATEAAKERHGAAYTDFVSGPKVFRGGGGVGMVGVGWRDGCGGGGGMEWLWCVEGWSCCGI